jgi:hypothetical protein
MIAGLKSKEIGYLFADSIMNMTTAFAMVEQRGAGWRILGSGNTANRNDHMPMTK